MTPIRLLKQILFLAMFMLLFWQQKLVYSEMILYSSICIVSFSECVFEHNVALTQWKSENAIIWINFYTMQFWMYELFFWDNC